MEMDRPPACDSQKGPDRKLKSNLEWPNVSTYCNSPSPLQYGTLPTYQC